MIRFLYPDSKVFVFSRTERERQLALNLGAYWADDIDSIPPFKLHVAIDTTPVWKPTIEVLKHLLPAGRLVINAIRKQDSDKEELLKLDYSRDLWLEKEIKSVANITRNDIEEFLKLPLRFQLSLR